MRFYLSVCDKGRKDLNSSMTTSLAVSLTASFASSSIFIMKGVKLRNEKLC